MSLIPVTPRGTSTSRRKVNLSARFDLLDTREIGSSFSVSAKGKEPLGSLPAVTMAEGDDLFQQWIKKGERLNLRGEKLTEFIERQLDQERQREEKAKEREFELERERMRLAHEKELKGVSLPSRSNGGLQTLRLKLPYFDDKQDDLDTYIARFERLARVQRWEDDTWGIRLGSLLTGKALEVYNGLDDHDASSYESLTNALRAKFRLTSECYRKRLRSIKRQDGETFQQFVVRMGTLLKRWLSLSKKEQTFDDLRDLVLREQLMSSVSVELATFIRERNPANVEEAAELAQHFVEARQSSKDDGGGEIGGGQESPDKESKESEPNDRPDSQDRGRTCFYCQSPSHIRINCPKWKRDRQKEAAVVSTVESAAVQTLIPTLCKPCAAKPYDPNCLVLVEGQEVVALRDTGATTLVVMKDLVPLEKLTGKTRKVIMAETTLSQELPVALIEIETPFYVGKAEAIVMDNPIRPLLIGNVVIDGEGEEHSIPIYANPDIVQAAVETRSPARRQPVGKVDFMKPLKQGAKREELIQGQQVDPSLEKIRQFAKRGSRVQVGKKGRVQFYWKGGVLQCSFQSGADHYDQIVVPIRLRHQVISLAHDSAMVGHMGVRRTQYRVLRDFYWPGVNRDVRRFCSSCDVCQRVSPSGKVKEATLGKMPLIGEPFRRVGVDLVGPTIPASERGHRYLHRVKI